MICSSQPLITSAILRISAAANSGTVITKLRKCSAGYLAKNEGWSATTVADRGKPSIADSSPSNPPGPTEANRTTRPEDEQFKTRMVPSMTK